MLLLSVAANHFYGAWHSVAHFGHQARLISAAAAIGGKATQVVSVVRDLMTECAALEAACKGRHGLEDHHHTDIQHDTEVQHSCVSLDGVCAALTPTCSAFSGVFAAPSAISITLPLQKLRAHVAWTHANARAPPQVFIG